MTDPISIHDVDAASESAASPAPNPSPASGKTPGAKAISPLSMSKGAWIQVLKRMWAMWGFHNLSLLGAGVAFFVFLAITPLIAATVMIYGLVGDVATVQRQMEMIVDVVPRDAAVLIEDQLVGVVSANTGVTGLALAVALFFAIYGGMRAATGLIGALNIVNEEHETRNFIRVTIRAALLTVAAVLIALTGIVSAGVFAWLQLQTGTIFGPVADPLFKLLAWAAAITLGSAGFALIMRYGPDRKPAKWRWLIPGAVLATVLWIAISFGFSLYVAYVSDYNATYGSLSAIVVFLMWLFLSAYGILAGALLNAELERQTEMDSTIGPDKPIGSRGAVLADVVSGDSSMKTWREQQEHRRAALHPANREK